MLDRRYFLAGSTALTLTAFTPFHSRAAELSEDGLHIQPWFLESFLELAEDRKEAAAEGKHLAVVFEQKGCPYCREMHRVNLANEQIVEYLKANFNVLQLNMWGSRMVTDLDGEELAEKELTRKWGVNFTPTIVFLKDGEAETDTLRDLEATRMPGYFKPFHFLSMFEFVAEDHYKTSVFQRYLQDKFKKLEAEGKKPDVW